MEWNGMEWNGMVCRYVSEYRGAIEWNGMVWYVMEWNVMVCRYVSEYRGHRIRSISPGTGLVLTLAGDGRCDYVDGKGLSASFR